MLPLLTPIPEKSALSEQLGISIVNNARMSSSCIPWDQLYHIGLRCTSIMTQQVSQRYYESRSHTVRMRPEATSLIGYRQEIATLVMLLFYEVEP